MQLRKAAGYSIADIADMTGFTYQTISRIEKTGEGSVTYIIEIAKAIGVPPKDIFDVKFGDKPRFSLSPNRKEKVNATMLIEDLYDNTDFFNSPRYVRDVLQYFYEKRKLKLNSVAISAVLGKMVKNKSLKFQVNGRQKMYSRK